VGQVLSLFIFGGLMAMRNHFVLYAVILTALCMSTICGCGNSNSPVSPDPASLDRVVEAHSGRLLLGMFHASFDPMACEFEVTPLRSSEFTVNITQFLQPPVTPVNNVYLSLDPTSDIFNGYLVFDMTIRHPFMGFDKFHGFDFRTIFYGDGSGTLSYDDSAVYSVEGETMLLNADGYTRWWNWQEFTGNNTIFGANQGTYAPPNQCTTTINGYKLFCDDLDLDEPVSSLDPETRGIFMATPGLNTRKFKVQFKMDGGMPVFDFNYSIDTSWDQPVDSFAPLYPPEAFPPHANCAEAYQISVTDTGSTAWYVSDGDCGGWLELEIEVFDWQSRSNPDGMAGELAGLWLDGEPFTDPVDILALASDPLPGGITSSIYQVEINSLNLTHSGLNEVWVIAENTDPDNYEPNLPIDPSPWTFPDSPLAAYFRTAVIISDQQPEQNPLVHSIDPDEGEVDATIDVIVAGLYFGDGCQVELRESGSPTPWIIDGAGEFWVDATEVECSFDLTGAPTGFYDVAVINPSLLEGVLPSGFEVTSSGPEDVIYVDDSNITGIEDGTMANPYDTIHEGLFNSSPGWEVWVDDSGIPYDGEILLVSGVVLKSVNWDISDGGDMATILQDNNLPAVIGADDATIDGFIINGHRYGIDCNGTSPRILNCSIINLRHSDCTGIWIRNGSYPYLENVGISDLNNNTDYGYATFWGIKVENCDQDGDNRVIIEHATVHNMFSSDILGLGGGYCWPHGILISDSDGAIVRNCIVHDITGGNYHEVYGIRVADSANVELVNNTIHDIEQTFYYGIAFGLHISNCTDLDSRNNIIYRVKKSGGFQDAYGVYQTGSTYSFEYNDVFDCTTGLYQGLTPGTGCITGNPEFVDPGNDYHLDTGSPCIDTGDPSIFDTDSSISDMGAYGGPFGDW